MMQDEDSWREINFLSYNNDIKSESLLQWSWLQYVVLEILSVILEI